MNDNKLENMKNVGNFTRGAIKEFEENIVSQHNYLEKVDKNLKSGRK
ncbi:hypothetical protein [Clostridium chauvoei]|uniref:Uncharacterized protein n=2 Tax=Clostridium chauvoei TaxID=46867 RepID=S6EZJ8_9CLOT|nr:hypothetical protein [Clostridium chauvoei]MBX7279443.1 hypothetical protein [Clostridium chauvoei]MBX7282471.1 hypothetical protein [Clostridium chauvoei]MBX7285642.1 hypothetical protein [Clostridium chauvoei]MBX7287397.1 hypothetical protein [Clostridium chauvoei]MBX7289534.1 hypothetical protein [Clostridium chauvoei]